MIAKIWFTMCTIAIINVNCQPRPNNSQSEVSSEPDSEYISDDTAFHLKTNDTTKKKVPLKNKNIVKNLEAEPSRNFNALNFQKSFLNANRQRRSAYDFMTSVVETEANSYQLMEFSRGIASLITMYEATDSISYLKEAIQFCKKVIDLTEYGYAIEKNPQIFKDKYKGWVNRHGTRKVGPNLSEVPLFESYFFRYLAKLVYTIRISEDIPQNFKADSQKMLQFLETNGWEKWYTRGEKVSPGCYPYLFRKRTHMTSHWALVALYLRELTRDKIKLQQYNDFLDLYDRQLKAQLRRTTSDAYIWNMTWDKPWPMNTQCNNVEEKPVIQDVSHGNHVVTYIVQAYAMGSSSWNESDIHALCNTVKYVLYDSDKNRFYGDLNQKFLSKTANGIQMADGFVRLSRYDERVYDLFRQVYFDSDESHSSNVYYAQYIAEMKLASQLYENWD